MTDEEIRLKLNTFEVGLGDRWADSLERKIWISPLMQESYVRRIRETGLALVTNGRL